VKKEYRIQKTECGIGVADGFLIDPAKVLAGLTLKSE